MSQDSRKDLPPVTAPNFLEKVREVLSTYLGSRGDKLDRGVTLRDLTDSGIVTLGAGFLGSGRGAPISGPGSAIPAPSSGGGGTYVPDLTPPPTATGFTATAAISNVLVECAPQIYAAGNGHGRSKLYGATWTGGALPVFADAEVITEFQGNVASYATNPATTWHLWLTWVTVDGVESSVPAGGTNGVVVTTGQDVSAMVAAMTGTGNPFTILNTPTVIDGVTFPAGTYSTNAFIQDAQITSAKIKDLAVDNAKIASMSVAKLTAGTMGIGAYIQSTNYTPGPSGTGFRINADGTAEMQAAYVRGQITASQIDARGLSIKDGSGNIILSAGSSIQSQINPYQYGATANQSDTTTNNGIIAAASTANWSQVYNNDGNRPANGATVGATFGVNIGGKINAGNASTYIDSLAVNTLQIANNAVTVPATVNYNPGGAVWANGSQVTMANIGVNNIGAGTSPVFVTGMLRFFCNISTRAQTYTWADDIYVTIVQQYTNAQLFYGSFTAHRNEAIIMPISFYIHDASVGSFYVYAGFTQVGLTGTSDHAAWGASYYSCNQLVFNMQGVKR